MNPTKLIPFWMILPVWLIPDLAYTQLIYPQSNTFKSNFSLNAEQIQLANLSQEFKNNVEVAVNYERSNWATGSVSSDPFYKLPDNITAKFSSLKPGTLLKVEHLTNTSLYTIAPTLALSRILFTTETFNSSTIPASAFILWPFSPNLQPGTSKTQTVVWAHGTSGTFGDCAPSHIRNLWYQYSGPFPLALAGYAVVAPDFQGLGVDYTVTHAGETEFLRNPWIAQAPMANDLFYAQQAALQAFPSQLSSDFVIMGHSSGGGVAWAAAERQAVKPVSGYLGTVAGSPAADYSKVIDSLGMKIPQAGLVAWSTQSIFPEFELSEVLTPLGLSRFELLAALGGCQSTRGALLGVDIDELLQDNWSENPYIRRFFELTGAGGKQVAGPLMVIQGTADPLIPEVTVTQTVNETCEAYPLSPLKYLVVNGTTHVPTLFATQKQWLRWISDRFAGVPVDGGCQSMVMQPSLPIEHYQKETNYFLEWETQAYEVA